MPHRKNFRVYFLLALLLIFAIVILLREHRPSVLRPDLHLNAYISTSDGSLTVVDLASLRVINKIPVGPAISDLREHAKRPEIWGVSSAGGYVFVLNARTSQLVAKIPVGPSPLSLDFSSTGDRVYTTSAVSDQLLAIDIAPRSILLRPHPGPRPPGLRPRASPHHARSKIHSRRQPPLFFAHHPRRRHAPAARR